MKQERDSLSRSSPDSGRSGPLVSTVMAVKNVESWIVESLGSVLRQSLRELEVIVIDDGSTDDTARIVREIQSRDPRVRWAPNPGIGGAQARNYGVTLARGRFLAFVDGDDIVPRDAYRQLTDAALRSGSTMVVGSHIDMGVSELRDRAHTLECFRTDKTRVRIADEPLFLRDRVVWNRLVDRGTWLSMGNRFEDSARANDILAATKLYCSQLFDVVSTPVYMYRRRVGPGSMSVDRHTPTSQLAYLEQEMLCSREIASVDEGGLLGRYFSGILEHDVWAQAVPVLRRRPLEGDADVQRMLRELVSLAPTSSLDELSEEKRLVYSFVRESNEEFARLVLSRRDAARAREHLRASTLADFVRAAHDAAPNINGVLAEIWMAMFRADNSRNDARLDELRNAQIAGIPRQRLDADALAEIGVVSGSESKVTRHAGTSRPSRAVLRKARDRARYVVGRVRRRWRQWTRRH